MAECLWVGTVNRWFSCRMRVAVFRRNVWSAAAVRPPADIPTGLVRFGSLYEFPANHTAIRARLGNPISGTGRNSVGCQTTALQTCVAPPHPATAGMGMSPAKDMPTKTRACHQPLGSRLYCMPTEAAWVFAAHAGQTVIAAPSEWARNSTPTDDGAEDVSVCLPAFSPESLELTFIQLTNH